MTAPAQPRSPSGSPLKRLLGWWLSDPLIEPLWRFLAAMIVVAGPWLVAVLALALISVTMTPAMGHAAVEDLRLTIVYAFCIAPIIAGPIGAVAARRISSAIDTGDHHHISEMFIAAAAISGIVTLVAALAVCWLLGIHPIELATGFVFLTVAAALLWTSFAILPAVRANGFLIAAFSGGMAFSVVCTLLSASRAPTTEMLVWCFTAGALLCVALCLRHIQKRFPTDFSNFLSTILTLLRALRENIVLAAGVLFAICGVWADKWVFWFGPDGIRSSAGLLHYGPYDSVMFLAHLSIIPSYAALLMLHHGDLTAAIERIRAAIAARATYGAVRARRDDLTLFAWKGMLGIIFIQGALTFCFILMAPLTIRALDFSFNQFLMLRIGLIGAFVHSTMFLCCAVMLLASLNRHYMLVQAGFFALNLTVSILLYAFVGVTAYAFLASALIAAMAAIYGAFRALHSYDYLMFLGENESLYTK